ncbi:MAG: hypothetical protein IPK80_03355 [Nannocystis sp.]|nr:hypothetical protein [Nannocystis sp.]
MRRSKLATDPRDEGSGVREFGRELVGEGNEAWIECADPSALVIIERPARDALTILIPKAWRYQTSDYREFSKIEIHRYQS